MRKTNLTPLDDDYIARLQNAIRQLNHCESTYVESVTVSESLLGFQKNSSWEGDVAVFQIFGHPHANRAYAWSYENHNKHTGCVVVLEIAPVTSPRTAVQAALAAQIVNRTFPQV